MTSKSFPGLLWWWENQWLGSSTLTNAWAVYLLSEQIIHILADSQTLKPQKSNKIVLSKCLIRLFIQSAKMWPCIFVQIIPIQ